jgi:plasmid stabilization system protein ParE
MRVRFTPQADRQYLEALRYIHSKNPAGAVTVMGRAEDVPPYRFFYRVVGDTVWITAVWHSRQLPEEPDPGARG